MVKSQMTRQQSTRRTRQQCSNSQGTRGSETVEDKKPRGKERKTRKIEEGSNDECGVRKTNNCDTTMDANWLTPNRHTSMVQTVLYSGCTETAASCSPYCTCIQYSSDATAARKKEITKFIMVKSQAT
jgi:hypothetical protein